MRILYASGLYRPHIGGGAEIVLDKMVRAFSLRGQTVKVVSTTDQADHSDSMDGIDVTRLNHRNVNWHFPIRDRGFSERMKWHARDRRNKSMGEAFTKELHAFRPDIVCTHNLAGLSVEIVRACSELGIPVVQVLHDYYHVCPKVTMRQGQDNCESQCLSCKILRTGHRSVTSLVSAVVGVSRAVLQRHIDQGYFHGVPLQRVIYNAQNLAPMHTSHRKSKPANTVRFGFIGGLSDVKGVELLLDSFLRIVDQLPCQATLVLAGTGRDEYVNQLKTTYQDRRISFLGKMDPLDYFGQVDVSVVPSVWHDPFPGVAYEGLAYDVPVIGSCRGGIPEIVQHRKNGLIFDPADRDSLDRCLLEMGSNETLRLEMSTRARNSIATLLDESRMLVEYEQLFEQVLASRQPVSPRSGGST